MRPRVVWAFLKKDTKAFLRDRFFVLVTFVGLAFYIGIFQVIPDTVDEVVEIGFTGDIGPLTDGVSLDDSGGITLSRFGTEEELLAAVEAGEEVMAGVVFPEGFVASMSDNVPTNVKVITGQGVPAELEGALESAVRELAFMLAGDGLPVTLLPAHQVVLGVDRAGDQVSMQEKMRPLFAFLILMVEAIALGSLIADELQQRTIQAVLVTPVRVREFLASKAVFGTLLAFGEVLVILIALRALSNEPLLVLTAALLGAVMVTGFALVAGSLGKEFITVLFWSMLFMVPLVVPAGALMFPGQAAGWIRLMPSYPLAEIIFDVTALGSGWSDSIGSLLALLGWGIGVLAFGSWVLHRRVVTQ